MAHALNSRASPASSTIPFLMRFLLVNVEPVFAVSGAVLVYTNPLKYASTMSRNIVSSLDVSTTFIYTELVGAWLYLAFTEAVVLRFVDDVRVWRLLALGMLLSDIAYCHSCAQAVGGWAKWLVVSDWTVDDWTVSLTTWPFVLSRIAIVMGLGFNHDRSEESLKSE